MIPSPSPTPSPFASIALKRQNSDDVPRTSLSAAGPQQLNASRYSSSSSGGFAIPASSSALGTAISTGTSTPTIGLMSVEEGSSTSHASSSRPGTSTTTSRQQLYQPLSLADALSRANDDETRALDEVLAERNKLCLEATKLGTENVRIWNLVRRIKKENEDLRASSRSAIVASNSTPVQPTSSTLSPSPSGVDFNESTTTPSSLGISNLLSPSKGSPLASPILTPLNNTLTARQLKGSDPTPLAVSNTLTTTSPLSTSVSSPPSTTTFAANSLVAAPAINDQQDSENKIVSPTSPSSSTLQHSVNPNRDILQSPQQTSIIQQRAAAQAQRLAAMTSPKAGGESSGRNSQESHDFEAIDGSSNANSDEDASGSRAGVMGGTSTSKEPQSNANPATQVKRFQETIQGRRGRSSDSLGAGNSSSSPRLDANMLPYINVGVVGTNLRSNDRGRDDISFYISVDLKAPPSGNKPNTTTWRVEKVYSDILALDARLKQKHGKSKNAVKRISAAQLPDRSLFKDHAPSKVDKRKVMLEVYLQNLLAIPLPDKDDLCTFLCTDAVPIKPTDPDATSKEGFLTKKGANLGRWVTRLYVLSGSTLDYYEARGGPHLGSINIVGAQIGRQQRSDTATAEKDMDENSYRHAFLILESKQPSSAGEQKQMVRHVLCAESDEERDDWVDILVRAIANIAGPSTKNTKGRSSPSRSFSASSVSVPSSPMTQAIRKTGRQESRDNGTSRGGVGATNATNNSVAPLTLSPRAGTHPLRSTEAPLVHVTTSSAAGSNPASTSGGGSDSIRSHSDVGRYSTDDQYSNNGLKLSNHHQQQQNFSQTQPLFSQQQSSVQPNQPSHSQQPPMAISASRSRTNTQDNSGSNNDISHTGPSQMTESASSASGVTSLASKDRDRNQPRPAISGPMNGTPIPTGYKFGGGKEEASSGTDTKKRFWHRFGGAGSGSDKGAPPKKVFGVSLAESIAVSNVAEGLELPSVVYRCIEYLEKKNAAMEEGIYRLSGSSNVIKSLRERFNAQGDVNLLAPSEPFYDPHAIAGLLKQFLRELTNSVLTRELHFDFMRVNDIVDRKERVNELGHLVSLLPLANYSLLRTLCSHLIKVIELSDVNKMTMRNVGIVFSPTLGIPGGVFALFLTEFDWVFFTDAKGEPAPKQMEEDIIAPDSVELGKTSDEQWQDHLLQQRQESTPEGQDPEEPVTPGRGGGGGSQGGNHKNRSSWISGNTIHSGDGKVLMSIQQHQQQNRDNRNSLCYNESEADKLLGGPQSRYRLTSHHEELEAMMGSTPIEAFEGSDDNSLQQYEGMSEQGSNNDDFMKASPSMSTIPIQASPRTTPRKLHNQNNLTLNRNAISNDGSYRHQQNQSIPTTPTSPTSSMRTGRSNLNNAQNQRVGTHQSSGLNEGY